MGQVSEHSEAIAGTTCEEVRELLPLVADGVLDREDDPQLFEHLAACPDCQEELMLHDCVQVALSATAPKKAAPKKRSTPMFFPLPLAAAAAVILSVGIGGVYLGGFGGQGAAPIPVVHIDEPVVSPDPAVTAKVLEQVDSEPVATIPAVRGNARIVKVLPRGKSRDHTLYVVRQGDRLFLIRADQLDSGARKPLAAEALPVARRY